MIPLRTGNSGTRVVLRPVCKSWLVWLVDGESHSVRCERARRTPAIRASVRRLR